MYANPIPTIDVGKKFEMRLDMEFKQLVSVEEAKLRTARYILEQTPETLASWLCCTRTKPIYPADCTPEELARLGVDPEQFTLGG